jgi:drug/metabolite transporter (DMT)-like permease
LKKNSEDLSQNTDNSGLPVNASLFTIFLCILFGANAVAVKISFTGLGVFTSAGVRFCTAALAIFLWARFAGKPLALRKSQFRQLFFLALIFFVQLSLFYAGQNKTTASHGTLIANVLPFGVMLLAHYFIPGEVIVLRKFLGLVLGFLGVLLLFLDSARFTAEMVTGDLLILLAVGVWSCNAVYTKRIISGYDPIQITLYPMMMSSLLFLGCGFIFDDSMVSKIDTTIIKAMLYQIFVTASFGMVAWNTLIRRYGATSVHSFVYIMPVSGVVLGVLILNEPLTYNLIVSVLLIAAGLVIVNRRTKIENK